MIVWTEKTTIRLPLQRAASQSEHFCKRSPQFEDVLLLLVVGEELPAGVGEVQGLLAVIGGAVAEALGVLVGRELTRFQDAVEVVPRPEERRADTGRCDPAPVACCELTSSCDWLNLTCWKTSCLSLPRRACGPAGPPAAQSGLPAAPRAWWPPSPLPPRRRTAPAPETRSPSSTRWEAWARPLQTGGGMVGDRNETNLGFD